MSWRHFMVLWATKATNTPWIYWGLVSTSPPCTDRSGTTSAAARGALWAMHQCSTQLPVISLKSWQLTSQSLRLLVMGEKMFSLIFSQSSPRPYRSTTRKLGQWPRCWFMSGSNAVGSPRRFTVTRVGTLNLSWWKPCVSSVASRRPGPLHITLVAMHSVSDSGTPCMTCFEPCPRNRRPSGHSTSRSLCRHITIRLTLPPDFRPTSSGLARNLSCQMTTCLGAQPYLQLDTLTGYGSIDYTCRICTPEHWNVSKNLQRRDKKQTDQKAADHPLHVGDWSTSETMSLAGAWPMASWTAHRDGTSLPRHICVWGQTILWWEEQTLSQDDLLPARAPMAAATEEPIWEALAQAHPQYPDRGEFWLGRPMTVGLPPAAPIPAAPIPATPFLQLTPPPPPPPRQLDLHPGAPPEQTKAKCSVVTLMLSWSTVYLLHHDWTLMSWPLIWYYLIVLCMFIWAVTGSVDRVHIKVTECCVVCEWVMFVTSIPVNLYTKPCIFVCGLLKRDILPYSGAFT